MDFGASDSPMTDEQMLEREARCCTSHRARRRGTDLQRRRRDQELKFTPTRWPASSWGHHAVERRRTRAANPGVTLPANGIVVVHRSDGSGTTFIWTDYLSQGQRAWKSKVGDGNSVNWPVGLGGKGNEGVAGW